MTIRSPVLHFYSNALIRLNSYTDRGKGTPLVFVHAFPLNHQMWNPQAEHFHATHRVVTFDLHGFGAAPPVGHAMTMERYADELAELLRHLSIQRCVLAGLSMGGYIAFSFLKKYAPMVAGLVLANTRAGADSDEMKATRAAQAESIRTEGIAPFLDRMIERLLGETTRVHRLPVVRSVRTLMDQSSSEGTIRMLHTLAEREDATPFLPHISIPACIIAGGEDVVTPVHEAQLLHASIPHAQLHVIDDTGHISNMETPDRFNSILDSFLSGLSV